ncbi:hypothetical protein [Absidia glauca]|uniref:C2H2-type domain-containing protein n=1 Tax=Absidia glauca TaxID=4829 RepID=A0A168MQP8_ABSGL|nr:hypothetical protein [Absidia glauca]
MWPALIRGSVFSSIRSSALTPPADNPSEDILPSLHDSIDTSGNIHSYRYAYLNNNTMDRNSTTGTTATGSCRFEATTTIMKKEEEDDYVTTTQPSLLPSSSSHGAGRRCEMLSIKELTNDDDNEPPETPLQRPHRPWTQVDRHSIDRRPSLPTMPRPSLVSTGAWTGYQTKDHPPPDSDNKFRHYDPHGVCNSQWHEQATDPTATTDISSAKREPCSKYATLDTASDNNGSSFSSSSSSSLLKHNDDQKQHRRKKQRSSVSSTSSSDSSTASSSSSSSASSSSSSDTDKEDNTAKRRRNHGSTSAVVKEETENRPFACPLCQRRFNRRYNLNAHIRIHDPHRKKLFDCPVCTQSFDRKHDRDRHVDALHFENKRRALCQLCEASFTRRDALIRHMHKIHPPNP